MKLMRLTDRDSGTTIILNAECLYSVHGDPAGTGGANIVMTRPNNCSPVPDADRWIFGVTETIEEVERILITLGCEVVFSGG